MKLENEMPRVAIVIDDRKLPVFDRHLTEAGYTFERLSAVIKGTITLAVTCDSIGGLEQVVRAANTEARNMQLH